MHILFVQIVARMDSKYKTTTDCVTPASTQTQCDQPFPFHLQTTTYKSYNNVKHGFTFHQKTSSHLHSRLTALPTVPYHSQVTLHHTCTALDHITDQVTLHHTCTALYHITSQCCKGNASSQRRRQTYPSHHTHTP